VAIIEKMLMTPQLRRLVAENRPAGEVRELAVSQGMKTLKRKGIQKALQQVTTPEEILRVCLSDE
jgi:type II secretory ATPase GspE/PulE/Tfp pilus assembly ATPase PilB-like protein